MSKLYEHTLYLRPAIIGCAWCESACLSPRPLLCEWTARSALGLRGSAPVRLRVYDARPRTKAAHVVLRAPASRHSVWLWREDADNFSFLTAGASAVLSRLFPCARPSEALDVWVAVDRPRRKKA